MTIRILDKTDADEYRHLRKFALQESPFAFCDSLEDEATKSIKDYQQEISNDSNKSEKFTLGAFSSANELVGFVKFKREERTKASHKASLHALYVHPEYRNHGVATKLINCLLERIEAINNLEQLILSTTITSKVSLVKYYEKFGFEIIGGH
ncbi:GNAT family N-acetyltransferase [Flavobacterium sp. NG2]|uniref:GNAT family N-acetyltransferase n=1 Tax=Flavobacterium sp. NG2 TaxID=3097547 RepID=UPI002A7F4DCA|nr:GNAT family N-acetyltransferase [Flavobacterium sp. NG2]WPR70313.1 GNAT family N-acetyltransferase [Flavobacterium sp. NG2]